MIKKILKTLYIFSFIGLFIYLTLFWPEPNSLMWIFYLLFSIPMAFIMADGLKKFAMHRQIKRAGKPPGPDNGVIL